MTDALSAPVQPEPTGPTRRQRFAVFIGWRPDPSGRPSYIWLERWNAQIYAIFVGLGVPLVAWLHLSDLTRWKIAAFWFAIASPMYFYFEMREIIGQMQGRGSLDAKQVSEQQNTAQWLYWGAILALVLWLVFYAVHVARNPDFDGQFVWNAFWTTPLPYGWLEWMVLLQTWLIAKFGIQIIYNSSNEYLKATPRAERAERRIID